jgi:predicted HAD superfamily Cof-like phosphohydrolase
MSEFNDVKLFHQKFGMLVHDKPVHLTKRKLLERLNFLREELAELEHGILTQDLAEIADALVDLVYVAKGTAVQLGLPWKELWDDVQRANMTKERGVGKRGNKVDCIKPAGWVGPKTLKLLEEAGYVQVRWLDPVDNLVDERRCIDDPEHTTQL